MSDIKLDGDAAVVGGIHTDSHNTQNNYNITNNSTVNNKTVYEAQKTQTEIISRTNASFSKPCRDVWWTASRTICVWLS